MFAHLPALATPLHTRWRTWLISILIEHIGIVKFWAAKFQYRVAIYWWTFARCACRQIALGFAERQLPEASAKWKRLANKYDMNLGMALGGQLGLMINRAMKSPVTTTKPIIDTPQWALETPREPVSGDLITSNHGTLEVWSMDGTTRKGFIRNGNFERDPV